MLNRDYVNKTNLKMSDIPIGFTFEYTFKIGWVKLNQFVNDSELYIDVIDPNGFSATFVNDYIKKVIISE